MSVAPGTDVISGGGMGWRLWGGMVASKERSPYPSSWNLCMGT